MCARSRQGLACQALRRLRYYRDIVQPSEGDLPQPFGAYVLVERLAIGGMGELFRAVRQDSGDTVVIKRLLPHLAADASCNAMFVDEARVASRLVHPKIVRTHELGKYGGQLYIVMEYVDGVDLLDVLAARARLGAPLSPPLGAYIAREVLDALEFAHNQQTTGGQSLGIVHRDVSPANVLLALDGRILLSDFGVAKAVALDHRTDPGALRGKYGYMAPEQVMGREVDVRTDVFAVAVVLTEMLLGRRLFKAASDLDQLLLVRDVRLDVLDRHGGNLPPDLVQILRCAMRKHPGERYASAAEFRDVLGGWLATVSVTGPAQIAQIAAEAGHSARRRRAAQPSAMVDQVPEALPEIEVSAFDDAETTTPEDDAPDELDEEEVIVAEQDGNMAPMASSVRFAASELAEAWESRSDRRRTGKVRVKKRASTAPGAPTAPAPSRALQMSFRDERRADAAGELAATSPLRLIARHAGARATGMLELAVGARRKHIYFVDGLTQLVESNSPGELFGEYLVERNVIDRAALAEAIVAGPRFGGRLGDALIGLGLLQSLDVFRHLARHARYRLIEACGWREGRYAWYRDVAHEHPVFPIDLDIHDVLCAAAASLSDRDVDAWVAAMGNVRLARRDAGALEEARLVGDGIDAVAAYRQLDGERDVNDVLDATSDVSAWMATARALYLLTETELAGPRER